MQQRAMEYKKLQAPAHDGEVLIEPPLDQAPSLLEQNLRREKEPCGGSVDFSLASLAAEAREELLHRAHRYTSAYRDVAPLDHGAAQGPILLAGHQPQLFHPGVWLKNFVLGSLAARCDATAVNLLIDNDTIRSTLVRVPDTSSAHPKFASVPFDRPGPEIPYEERKILDPDLLASFPGRLEGALSALPIRPMVSQLWPYVLEAAAEHNNLGQCLAQARHRLEGEWGLETLELPLSHVSQMGSFRGFAVHLLAELPRLHEVYNTSLCHYRHIHRIRSRSHPVADLSKNEGFLEAPFWIWSREDPRRRRLFVRHHRDHLVLSDLEKLEMTLPLSADGSTDSAVEALCRLCDQGLRLRPRALITTMFARLLLGDLFLHGIGGAKYDQLTDLLMSRFFRLTPPGFMVVSGTALLPIRREDITLCDLRKIDSQLRELTFHPERHLDQNALDGDAAPWAEKKQHWISRDPPQGSRLERHQQITRANEALQPHVESQRRRLLECRAQTAASLLDQKILASREYAFCLFGQETLRPWIESVTQAD